MNILCFYSDRLQEYKQKHLELKAAVRKELANQMYRGEKSTDEETGCGKEVMDEGSPAVESNTESKQEQQPVEETSVESAAVVSANGHVVEPAENEEKTVDGGDSEHSDRAAEAMIVNGETESRAEAEESAPNGVKSSRANGEMKSDTTVDDMKLGSNEVNGAINGALDITASPSVLKNKGTWADVVVSKAIVANGPGDKVTAVNRVADVTANGSVEK